MKGICSTPAAARIASLAIYFGVAFALHFAWEHLHMPLYDVPPLGTWQRIKICLFATATGDMAFMLVIYVAIASVERNIWWALSKRSYRHFSTWFLTVLLGILLAASFEMWAVYVEKRWRYAEAMHLVPVLGVGFSPLLQMVAVPLATVAFHWRITSRLCASRPRPRTRSSFEAEEPQTHPPDRL